MKVWGLLFCAIFLSNHAVAKKTMTWDANTRGEACTNAKKILEIRGENAKDDCQCTQKTNGTWTCAAESKN